MASFAIRPWRALTVTFNALRGRETRKLETFLIELKRKGLIWLKSKLGWLPRKRVAAESAE